MKLSKGNASKNNIILPSQKTYWHLMNYLLFPPVFCLLFPQSPHKTGSFFKFDRNISDRLACHCCFQGWHPIWQIQTDQPFKTRNLLWMVMYIYRWFLSAPIVHILRIKNTLGKGLVINFRGGGGLNLFLWKLVLCDSPFYFCRIIHGPPNFRVKTEVTHPH